LAVSAQRLCDLQLRLRRCPCEDHLPRLQQALDLALVAMVEASCVHDPQVLTADTDLPRDCGRGKRMATSDHDDAHAGRVTPGHSLGYLGSGRIEHRDEPEEAEIPLDLLARRCLRPRR
jgi:hypothetical protein